MGSQERRQRPPGGFDQPAGREAKAFRERRSTFRGEDGEEPESFQDARVDCRLATKAEADGAFELGGELDATAADRRVECG